MYLKSKKYPGIAYEKGEEIFLFPEDGDLPFLFDVSDDLTADDEAMEKVAAMLDETDDLVERGKAFLKTVLADENSEHREVVHDFMEFHRDDIDPDAVAKLFPVETPSALSFEDMVDYLRLNRFGSLTDDDSGRQLFIMDLNFNAEVTDELMVIYFDGDKNIVDVAHES